MAVLSSGLAMAFSLALAPTAFQATPEVERAAEALACASIMKDVVEQFEEYAASNTPTDADHARVAPYRTLADRAEAEFNRLIAPMPRQTGEQVFPRADAIVVAAMDSDPAWDRLEASCSARFQVSLG